MRTYLLLLLLVNWQLATAQSKTRITPQPTAPKAALRQDFIVVQNTIWTLDKQGSLAAFSATGAALPSKLRLPTPGISLHATSSDSIIAHAGGKLIIIDTKNLVIKALVDLPDSICFLGRDKHQRLWAAGERGLLRVETGQVYVPDSTQNHYYKWLPNPSASLLDASGRLWIGFGMGEWGGNLHVFNTETQRFDAVSFRNSQACLAPVKSFCQVADQVYMSCGVMHFITFGCITRFEAGQPKPVLTSSYDKNYRTSNGQHAGEYLGPVAYTNNTLYYYSQNGIFKGQAGTDLARIESWQLVFSPRLHWASGQRDAVGPPMNVSKMAFTPGGKLVLLAPNDGVGLWDGKTFSLLP